MTLILILSFFFAIDHIPAQDKNVNIPQPTELVNQILNLDGYDWRTIHTDHAILYYQLETETEKKIEELKRQTEEGLERAMELLQLKNYDSGLRIFFLKNRKDQMNELIGRTVKAMTLFSHDAILMVHNKNVRPYIRHEIFHLVSYKELGIPYMVWLREGSAVFADGFCQKYDLETMGVYLLKTNRLIPLKELIYNFGDYNDILMYLQAGSFFQFIYENYGLDKVRELWELNEEDLEAGGLVNLRKLEMKWKKHLSSLNLDTKSIRWEDFKKNGCG